MNTTQARRATTVVTVSPPPVQPGTASPIPPTPEVSTDRALVQMTTRGKLTLTEDQFAHIEAELAKLDFEKIPTGDVVRLGAEAEKGLHKTLDGFLARIDKASAPQLFTLMAQVQKGVDDAKLPELLTKVLTDKPSFWANMGMMFRSKQGRQEIMRKVYQATCDLVAGRTKTLSQEIGSIEQKLQKEMDGLVIEIHELENLKQTYREHRESFLLASALTMAFENKGRELVEAKRLEFKDSIDPIEKSKVRELEFKHQALQSRALALEGALTKIPASEEMFRQIQNAGIMTFAETLTTSSARFASIKETLLVLNGSLKVRGVQQMTRDNMAMERQLAAMRGTLMKEVVTVAANAPGDNRVEQAQHITRLITEAKELNLIISTAKSENEKKFGAARESFAASRDEILKLSDAR